MAERERIIPIKLETDDADNEIGSSDSEQKLAEPMEKLTIKRRKIRVKAAPKPLTPEKDLKEFDVFEKCKEINLSSSCIPEKIIFVIDRAQDEEFTPFETKDTAFTPLSMLKRALNIFLKLKVTMGKKHEYAVIVLNENNAELILNFTSDVRKIWNVIDKVTECQVEDTFSMNCVFEEILALVEVPEIIDAELPPEYMVRVIMLWNRSYTFPQLYRDDAIGKMLSNPYFICDVLMTHETIDKSNHCGKIFSLLQEIDIKGKSYFLPVARDTKRLHNCMARLLSHPLQRPLQKLQIM